MIFEFAALALTLVVGAVLLLFGAAPAWVWPLVPLPYVLRHLYHLTRLAHLIRRRQRLTAPFPRGLWGEVYGSLARYQQRGRKGRKRQVRFSRRFRQAADAVPDGLVILDKLQRIEWANPAAAPLLDVHWPRDEGRRLSELLAQPDLTPFIEVGEYLRPLEITPEHNRALMVSLRIAPFGEHKGERLIVARDITKIYHLNMIRRDFVANASHELRTPLTVIAGFLENLADAPATPTAHRRPLSLMQHQASRMSSIIEDLLTLSRLEMDDQDRAQGPVDVAAELEPIVHEAQVLSEGRHRIECRAEADLLLIGNQVELRSAFSNLIHNAVRHTPPGTRIRIRWNPDANGARFSVTDDGEGIPPEHLPRLTERFYRVDQSRSRAAGGTGLGLAIVKHVLNRHDAHLLIASTLGKGSRFTCQFPAARALLRARPLSAAAEERYAQHPGALVSTAT
ncbi:phosphate regulon sensor histidine kinase PhoR [uncultured Thiodictyon sp.]|uniref:phosphate regulon sensor histidine kinase PhoR n=1 Tax=uncultured Thiodictyon sp. TaxID=1846217 RepID=UPI0025DF7BAC|nr:phosphate regulon sensor histidine kinase PhoR [uncultured Thiodictyon sp.]